MWSKASIWKQFLYIINSYILPAINRGSQQGLFFLTSQIIVISDAINVVRYAVSIVAAAANGISMRHSVARLLLVVGVFWFISVDIAL